MLSWARKTAQWWSICPACMTPWVWWMPKMKQERENLELKIWCPQDLKSCVVQTSHSVITGQTCSCSLRPFKCLYSSQLSENVSCCLSRLGGGMVDSNRLGRLKGQRAQPGRCLFAATPYTDLTEQRPLAHCCAKALRSKFVGSLASHRFRA